LSLAVTVKPPFWETWWFRAIALIGAVGLLFAGYRLRVRGIKAQQRKLEVLVTERAAELLQANQRLQTLTDHLQQELVLAQQIQHNLLPPPRPAWDTFDIICYTAPAHQVGGDFYIYHSLAGNLLIDGQPAIRSFALAVGDVSGKGLPAALLMAVSLASLQAVIDHSFPPNELLAHLDQVLVPYTRTTRQNCALCYIELHHQTLHVANAGCIDPLIKHADGKVAWVEAGGIPLGIGLGAQTGYDVVSLELDQGDLIILTSDGVVEAFNATSEMFGFVRLEAAVASGPTSNAAAMLEHLQEQVNTFVGATEPHDDLTIVVIQV
jgi:serine phosphatase RsbU (regulator of sigma subunit)